VRLVADVIGSAVVLESLDRLGQRGEAVDAADLLHAFDAQHVAHGGTRFDEAKGDAAPGEFGVQVEEHTGTGHVDIGRGRKVADHKADRLA
jgi:hypothetical protein